MKWFLVVVSLVAQNPEGDRDMWVIKRIYQSVDHCVYDANMSALGLMAKAHNEFKYDTKYPEIQPWDAWTVRCVGEKEMEEILLPYKEELGA